MPRKLKAFVESFDSVYRGLPYLVLLKARLLAAFNLFILLYVPGNILKLLWVQPPELPIRIALTMTFGLAALSSLLLAWRGRLALAGNVLVLGAILPVHALAVATTHYPEPLGAAMQLFIFDLAVLLMAVVFGGSILSAVILVFIVASHITFHHVVLKPPFGGSAEFVADTLLRDGLIAIGFVFCLGMVMKTIVVVASRRSEQVLRDTAAVNENLGRLVAERTRELEEATRRANDASQAKGDFLANMSHELRTPLNGIVASSELLIARPDLPPGAAEDARLIAESSDLLLQLVGDVLDLSKAEAGQIELENQPFDLSQLLNDTVRLVSARAAQSGVAIELKLAPGRPTGVIGDALRLRQILLNLLSNAIKFTASGGSVELAVAAQGSAAGQSVRFEVRDTGIGMDEIARQKLFHRFAQADSSTSRRFGGTGLGLAISARLVELMGGRLEAESTPGCGSTFHFSLPLRAATVASAEQKPDAGGASSLGLLVLIAEDNPINRKVLGAQLERLGCRYEVAADGEEALVALLREPMPVVVLMDCDMPNLDGWEATRRIRGWWSDPDATELQRRAAKVPIIALTAATLPEERTRCFEAGMTDYLAKPIKIAGLRTALEAAGTVA